jgi:hypothetical protein
VWGTHGHLWTGDEGEARELYLAVREAEDIRIPRVTLRPLTLDWAYLVAATEVRA